MESGEQQQQRVIDIFDDLYEEEETEYEEEEYDIEEKCALNKNKKSKPLSTTKTAVTIQYTNNKKHQNNKHSKNKRSKKTASESTTTSKKSSNKTMKITSVATQTPNFMMSDAPRLYDVIDPNTGGNGRSGRVRRNGATSDTGEESCADTYSELSLEFLNDPPPYHEAVMDKEQKF